MSMKKNPFVTQGRIENPSLGITVFHHLASHVMPKGDPWDGFFYPTLTLMIDSYTIQEIHVTRTTKMDQLRFHKASADKIPRHQHAWVLKTLEVKSLDEQKEWQNGRRTRQNLLNFFKIGA